MRKTVCTKHGIKDEPKLRFPYHPGLLRVTPWVLRVPTRRYLQAIAQRLHQLLNQDAQRLQKHNTRCPTSLLHRMFKEETS
jgi:hypothetical protein